MKNFLNIFFIFCLGQTILTSCKKEIPAPPADTAPVFYFTGNVDAVAKAIYAGENDYYMYSNVYQDANSVNVFDSHLKIYDCLNCSEDLQIIIKDYQTSSSSAPIIFANSISSGYYPYEVIGGASVAFNMNFIIQNPPGGISYFWDFGDGTSQTTPVNTTSHQFNRAGKYQMCVTVTYPSLATSTICNEVKVEMPDDNCRFNFSATAGAGTSVDFSPIPFAGTGPFTYLWNFGDGNTSTTASPTHVYSVDGSYTVSLQVTDANGSISTYYRHVNTAADLTLVANMNYNNGAAVANPLSLSNVTVNYTDADGLVWTSLDPMGHSNSHFKVAAVEDYDMNENGMPTKKVTIDFKCKVYNSGNTKIISQGSAVFAFAYHN